MRSQSWLGYAIVVGAMVSIGFLTLNYLEADGLTLERARSEVVSIERGEISAFVSLVDGAHKPHILYDGNLALEYSDWSSEVSSAGDSRTLWDTRFRVEGWEDAYEIVHTRHTPQYEISQVTKLEENHVVILYYVSPSGRAAIGPVTLTIGHFRWYFEDVQLAENGALLTALSQPEQIWFRQSTSGTLDVHSDEVGPHSFTTQYVLDDVPVGEQSLIAREEVWFEPPPGW